jgi:hypothetical protein
MTTVRDLQALPEKGLAYNLVVTVDSVGPVTTAWNQQYGRNDNKSYLRMRDAEGVEIWADLYLNDLETASLGNPPSIGHLQGQSYVLTPWTTSKGRQGGVEKITSTRDGGPRLRLKGLSVFVPYGAQQPRAPQPPTTPQAQGPRPAGGPPRPQNGPSGLRPVAPAKPTWEETERAVVTATRGIYLALREAFPAGETAIDRPSPDAFLEAAESIAVHLSIAAQRGDVQRPVVAPRPQLAPPPTHPHPGHPYQDPAWVSGVVEGAQAPQGGMPPSDNMGQPPAPWDDWPEEGGGA